MKKAATSIAFLIYFAFASGVMINYHYCMGRYDSFRLYAVASDYCTKCGMHTKKHGCCHDEIKIVKLQDDHQSSSVVFSFKSLEPIVTDLPAFSAILLEADILYDHNDHSPPLLRGGQDIYLRNRVFRI